MIKDNIQIAWAAGLFEGEGSFYQNTIKKKGKVYYYPSIALRMTDKDIVDRFAQIIEHNDLRLQKRTNPKHKDIWEVRVRQLEKVKEVADAFWPFLGSRRKAKFLAIVAQAAEASVSKTD